jgi:hypothetical protein
VNLLGLGMSDERQDFDGKREASRALVPVGDARDPAASRYGRPLATFIAQMLACGAKVPDFRQRRRAQPPTAAAAYAAAPGAPGPRRFERKL